MKIPLTLIILMSSIIISCNKKEENNYLDLIKGDWKLDTTNLSHEEFGNIFCFEDSLCSFNEADEYFKMVHNKDSIIVEPKGTDFTKKFFKIVKVNSDSLLLKIDVGFKQNGDTVLLIRLKKKNNLKPGEICFLTTGSWGFSGTKIKIDSLGNFFYFGPNQKYHDIGYKGVIQPELFQNLLYKIRQLPLDSLKPFYGQLSYDDGMFGLWLKRNDTVFSTISTYSASGPYELGILINYLYRINEKIKLTDDSSVTDTYFSSQSSFKIMQENFDSIMHRFSQDKLEENRALIKKEKMLLFRIKNKQLRQMKKQELELTEKALSF